MKYYNKPPRSAFSLLMLDSFYGTVYLVHFKEKLFHDKSQRRTLRKYLNNIPVVILHAPRLKGYLY